MIYRYVVHVLLLLMCIFLYIFIRERGALTLENARPRNGSLDKVYRPASTTAKCTGQPDKQLCPVLVKRALFTNL